MNQNIQIVEYQSRVALNVEDAVLAFESRDTENAIRRDCVDHVGARTGTKIDDGRLLERQSGPLARKRLFEEGTRSSL